MKVISEHTFDESLIDGDNGANIIDLGACLGDFTREFSNSFKIKKAVLVEANPTNFSQIPEISNTEKINSFVCQKQALKEILFFEDSGSPYNGTSYTTSKFAGDIIEHKIKAISIEDLIDRFGDEQIDILKVDIECAEYDLFLSIDPDVLKKIKQITIEFHDFLDPKLKEKTDLTVKKIIDSGFVLAHNKPCYFGFGSLYYDSLFVKL
jgi:FkbM family methyltransferase